MPQGNIPSSGVGLMTSQITTTFDIFKPQKRNELYSIHGDQGLSLFNLLDSYGYSRPIAGLSSDTYEEDWIISQVFIGVGGLSLVTAAPAPAYSFVLSVVAATNNYLPTSTTFPYSTAQYYPTVKLGDILMFPDFAANSKPRITAWVYDITGTGNNLTVFVKLFDTAATLNTASYVAGTGLIVTSNVFSEGSDQPKGQVSNVLQDAAYLQIFKKNFDYTGTQQIMEPWFDTYQNGALTTYVIKGQSDAEYLMQKDIDGALLFGETNTNTAQIDPVTNEPMLSTEGLFTYAARAGYTQNYTPGTITVSLFDQIANLLNREKAPHYSLGLMGFGLYQEFENVLKDYFQNTNIGYVKSQMATSMLGGDTGLEASIGFTYLKKSGHTFCFGVMGNFNHPRLYGAAGFNMNQIGLFAPLGRNASSSENKSNKGKSLPYIGMIYGARAGYNRKFEAWTLSGAGPKPYVLSVDLAKMCLRAHVGGEHVGGNHMVLVEP